MLTVTGTLSVDPFVVPVSSGNTLPRSPLLRRYVIEALSVTFSGA
jgi:hypothetical protein